MKIYLKECYIDEGSYGLVTFDHNRDKVVKIFKKNHTYEHANNVFRSEVEAYELASKNTDALRITPTFFGKVEIEEVFDEKGVNVTNNYHQKFAYKMSYENGSFVKINTIPDEEKKLIEDILHPLGIEYLMDSSVLLDDQERAICVIDFARKEFLCYA